MGQPQEKFVPKVEWRWDAIPSAVYDMIRKTLETGDVKYLETLVLSETSSREKIKREKNDKTDKERPRNGELFILNKYLDQVEIACKFAHQCQQYEKHISEQEKMLAVEKMTNSELKQKYQVILFPALERTFGDLLMSGPCPCQYAQLLQCSLNDMTAMDLFSEQVQHLDARLRENAALNCFMADFYRSHIITLSSFLEEERNKLEKIVSNDERMGKVMETIEVIQKELSKSAAAVISAFRSEVEGSSTETTTASQQNQHTDHATKLRNQQMKQKHDELRHKLEPLQQKSMLLKQQISLLETAKVNSLPVFNPPSSFPPPRDITRGDKTNAEKTGEDGSPPRRAPEDNDIKTSPPSPSPKKTRRKAKTKHRH